MKSAAVVKPATAKPVTIAKAEPALATPDPAMGAEAAVATPDGAQAEPAVVTPDPTMTAEPMIFIDPRVPAPTANAVITSYQRVGREIMQLQNLRGTECTLELWKTFRAIKLDQATATKEARIITAATLQDIQQKIARKKGITILQQCLDNPLAESCQ